MIKFPEEENEGGGGNNEKQYSKFSQSLKNTLD